MLLDTVLRKSHTFFARHRLGAEVMLLPLANLKIERRVLCEVTRIPTVVVVILVQPTLLQALVLVAAVRGCAAETSAETVLLNTC